MSKINGKKNIAVLGGGMGGLTCIKACLEEDLNPICFEGTEDIGGLWRYREKNINGISSLAKSTVINTSKEISAFSDLPPPEESPNYMSNRDMCKYFEMYADNFGLRKYINFNHTVEWVTPSKDFDQTGQWSVTVVRTDKDTKEETKIKDIYDGIMICTGHHVIPHIPKFPEMDTFKGKIIHTHDYKVANEFVDKNVMVVGTGNSGSDAAVEVGGVAKQTYLSTRRGFWIRNRVGERGYPFDMSLLTKINTYIPPVLNNYWHERKAQKVIDYKKFGLQAAHPILSQHPTVSDALPNRIICGAVKVKGPIKKFVPEGVLFEGEAQVTPLDAVIAATGYDVGFPYLDPKVAKLSNETCELYMFAFPPNLKHPTLIFIGNIQPIGPIFPIAELQARWYAQVVTGKAKLPPKDKMMAAIRERLEFNRTAFISGTRHVTEVLFVEFCDELADHFGAKPNLMKIMLTDPALFIKMFFGPSLSYQYRLQGPHQWKGARKAIMECQHRYEAALQTNAKFKGCKSNDSSWSKIIIWAFAILFIYICYIIGK